MTLSEAAALVGVVVATLTGLVILVGVGARLVLLPWLRTHLVEPLTQVITEALAKWSVATFMYDHHVTRCEDEWGRLWEAIEQLRKESKP